MVSFVDLVKSNPKIFITNFKSRIWSFLKKRVEIGWKLIKTKLSISENMLGMHIELFKTNNINIKDCRQLSHW